MPAPRRTKAELLSENQHLRERLAAMTPPSYSREIENLKAKLAAMQAAPFEPYVALKSVDRHGYDPITVWRWARHGLIDTKREGKRWFVKQSSLDARIRRLTGG
jgi:hypothetical protein